MKTKLTSIEEHLAGATIRHHSIFKDLPTYENTEKISQEFRDKWVIPFYFDLRKNDNEWINKMIALKKEISDDVILKNLGDFDWRTRSTGAFFAAIREKQELTEIIGNHLLKSEVCFAGRQYAVTLASFNSNESIAYLNRYLDYYLSKVELEFDQIHVAQAIKYLDEINGTNIFNRHRVNLRSFQVYRMERTEIVIKKYKGDGKENKNNDFWNNELKLESFKKSIETIKKIKNAG